MNICPLQKWLSNCMHRHDMNIHALQKWLSNCMHRHHISMRTLQQLLAKLFKTPILHGLLLLLSQTDTMLLFFKPYRHAMRPAAHSRYRKNSSSLHAAAHLLGVDGVVHDAVLVVVVEGALRHVDGQQLVVAAQPVALCVAVRHHARLQHRVVADADACMGIKQTESMSNCRTPRPLQCDMCNHSMHACMVCRQYEAT